MWILVIFFNISIRNVYRALIFCVGRQPLTLLFVSDVILVCSQVWLLLVLVQHAVSGQGSQAAAVPGLHHQGTVVKMRTPMYSCSPNSVLWDRSERWQKVGGLFHSCVKKQPTFCHRNRSNPCLPYIDLSFLPEWSYLLDVIVWEILCVQLVTLKRLKPVFSLLLICLLFLY